MCQGASGKVVSRHKQANDALYLDADHRFSDRREKSALNKACLKRWKEERVERLDRTTRPGEPWEWEARVTVTPSQFRVTAALDIRGPGTAKQALEGSGSWHDSLISPTPK